MASKATLQLQFLTDLNKKVHITIQNPKIPVDPQAVKQAMDLMVQRNIFAFPQGQLVKSIGANLVQTDTSSVG
ncbi:MAG: DUF2922 domain-containing protein [Chloroflexi bacterium]|uniref:DUF2922 family protein n=1 Tax=Alicyclobacillus cellulosilyticus TaxID=1003997 RepID=A0A917NIX7_9BACL|nr:DUF2922 domain-containing protein [Alicyclobacillus cellulosilyticus]MBX6773468.1 DUF2922 domain-containing protein [Chloroflexota bacterium]GGJ04077.1 hypothetical protein GCM10010885_11680 [Alicyclobacillus cellulosilyticus]